MRNLTTVAEAIADITENISEADKANVVNTPKADLIQYHHGWGYRYPKSLQSIAEQGIGKSHGQRTSGRCVDGHHKSSLAGTTRCWRKLMTT